MWVGPLTLEYVNYIMWDPEKTKNIHLLCILSM